MRKWPDVRGFRMKILGMAALACSGSVANAQVPPSHWTLPTASLAPATSPLSSAAQRLMILIPAGRYPIGRDGGARSERPRHEVALAAFRIDRTEVTNAAFAEFLNALRLPVRGSFDVGEISARNGDVSTLKLLATSVNGAQHYPIIELDDDEARIVLAGGRFQPAPGRSDHPVTEATWAGARAYCVWGGGDLPTEAQWEAAARGNGDRVYPWGDAPPNAERVSASGRTGSTAPVGLLAAGVSPFGVLDMGGSVAEWTRSLKRPYPYRADDGRENVSAAGERTTRGGDYVYDRRPANFTVSFRDGYSNAPERGHRHIGFRCVS